MEATLNAAVNISSEISARRERYKDWKQANDYQKWTTPRIVPEHI
jgi:hypothetical protein